LSDRAFKLGTAQSGGNAIDEGSKRSTDDEQARLRAEEAKRAADLVVARLQARPEPSSGLRGPEWAWYAAGFAALIFGVVALHFMRPPAPGVEPELLAPVAPPPAQKAAKPTSASTPTSTAAPLSLSASIWRGALELRVARLPSDTYGAVVLIDSGNQYWLVQRGDRQDPTCLPTCEGDLKTRVELNRLARGPFRALVLLSPKPMAMIPMVQWLQLASDEPPASIGARAYGSAKVARE
jgi:hypothetical protein